MAALPRCQFCPGVCKWRERKGVVLKLQRRWYGEVESWTEHWSSLRKTEMESTHPANNLQAVHQRQMSGKVRSRNKTGLVRQRGSYRGILCLLWRTLYPILERHPESGHNCCSKCHDERDSGTFSELQEGKSYDYSHHERAQVHHEYRCAVWQHICPLLVT